MKIRIVPPLYTVITSFRRDPSNSDYANSNSRTVMLKKILHTPKKVTRSGPRPKRNSARSGDLTRAEFSGPNIRKRHRKPDEIYGDVSIPDSERKE
jgi:hypothetical protein